MIRRGLRLRTVAGLGIALAMSIFASVASASSVSTETTLNVTTQDKNGQTKATLKAAVQGADGTAASGAVLIKEGSTTLASAALDASGQATSEITLAGGAHNLRAVYAGDSAHSSSVSAAQSVQAMADTSTSFTLALTSVSPSTTFPMTLTAGEAGTIKITVLPVNNASLSSPMFVTLSCSGLPDQASCNFSPTSVEILPTTASTSCASGSTAATCPPTSVLVLQTQAQGTAQNTSPVSSTIAWALLLPGMIGLGGIAWGVRRRRWIGRLSLIALAALVVSLGATGCNPRYGYYHHAPDTNVPTPSGSYTVKVTGQSSNGITAVTSNTTFALTVE